MKKVITMSRRTDMRWFAEKLIPVLSEKYPPEKVHTVVCITKFPGFIYNGPYAEALKKYDHVFAHVTITGLGGTPLEPNVPGWRDTAGELPGLIEFLGSPERIRLRVDPLVTIKKNGTLISNIPLAEQIIVQAVEMGIFSFSTSFMEEYPRVKRRLAGRGYEIITLTQDQRVRVIKRLKQVAQERGGALYTCAVPGFATSKCIDGALLQKLHPRKEPCSLEKAPGQRELCGCTKSVDIGWYNMRCPSGCLYCYAGV
ncbi:DUF1848 family protein [Desulfallas sp. Bu1-1]|uniref:DUF1848 family protein n=1 Tax=Desulfallas sp. Bu1-1 TaxID=2787620 RepID=UPI001FAC3FB0|nr:DUF1848 family protein [Desulfallas sp. Bu1-1]